MPQLPLQLLSNKLLEKMKNRVSVGRVSVSQAASAHRLSHCAQAIKCVSEYDDLHGVCAACTDLTAMVQRKSNLIAATTDKCLTRN